MKLDWTGVEAFRLEAIPAPERDTRDERQGRRARGEEEKEYLHIYGKRETRKENTCTLPPARSLPPPSLLCHHDTGGNPSHSQSCFCRLTLPSLFSADIHPSHSSHPVSARTPTTTTLFRVSRTHKRKRERERERKKKRREK